MNKLISIAAIFIIFSISIGFSQELSLGLSAGAVLSKPRITNDMDIFGYDYMFGYSLNSFLAYKTKSIVGFSVEPGYIRKGGKSDQYSSIVDKLAFNYINIPVMIDFYVVKELSLSVGVEPAFLIRAKLFTDDGNFDNTDLYEKFETSALAGFAYSPVKFLDIGFRYSHAFMYVSILEFTTEDGDPTGSSKTYNQYFQLFLRWRFISW